jgi:hypothetical protein
LRPHASTCTAHVVVGDDVVLVGAIRIQRARNDCATGQTIARQIVASLHAFVLHVIACDFVTHASVKAQLVAHLPLVIDEIGQRLHVTFVALVEVAVAQHALVRQVAEDLVAGIDRDDIQAASWSRTSVMMRAP